MEHKACPSCGEWDKRRRSVCANDWHGKADGIMASPEVGNQGFTASLTESSVAPRERIRQALKEYDHDPSNHMVISKFVHDVRAAVQGENTVIPTKAICPKCKIEIINTTAGVWECPVCHGRIVPSVAPWEMELPANPYEALLKLERVHGYLRANGLTGMFGPWCTVVDAKIILEHEINTSLYRERDAAVERYSLARLEGKRADG